MLFITIRLSAGEMLLLLFILLGVPILYLLDFIFYRNMFKRTQKNNKSFMFLNILWVIFWVFPVVFIFTGILTNEFYIFMSGFWGLFIMMLVLKIAMLIYGWVDAQDGIKRKWLLIAFFVPLIGSVLFFKKNKRQIVYKEMLSIEEIDSIFK